MRNLLIFGLFARMHLVEQVDSRIGRIQNLMKDAGLPDPTFQKEGIFTVTLYRPSNVSEKTTTKSREKSSEKGSEKSSEKIIELLEKNPEITIAEIAEKVSKSTRAVEKQLANLKKQGKIEREGPDKGGKWKVIKSDN